ncbi:MAG TPA: efflux RND transporter periplasmic adaptor subunit [Kofleriaceae bacterium]|nr:efflux RND transporter periplasmic adaptor subunit [Kofleriaceae bacterium]
MMPGKLGPALRARAVPIALGLALVIALIAFRVPLIAWFTGDAATSGGLHTTSPAPSAATPPAAPTGKPNAAPHISHEGHGHAGSDIAHYTCSMHPSVERKQPGTCPICSMTLQPVTYDEVESGEVRVDEARGRAIGLQTAAAALAPMSVEIVAPGRLTYDETRLVDVTLKVSGWVSHLRAAATGQPVRKGETLLSLYSPDLYAAQQEYLLALDSGRAASTAASTAAGTASTAASGRGSLAVAAEKKLRLWGMTTAELQAIARRRAPTQDVPIASPASGFIIEKDVVEGGAVEAGHRLFRIAALDKVWVEAQVYERDLPQVRVGQKATVTLAYQQGAPIEGAVAYVHPTLDPASRSGRVRIELPNHDLALKPDMFATVAIRVDLGPRLQIPADAVVYTGPRRLVFVDLGGGRLRPQEVSIGARSGDAVEVVTGLRAGDVVVTAASFLVAAESRIRSASRFWSDSDSDSDSGSGSGSDDAGGARPGADHAGH